MKIKTKIILIASGILLITFFLFIRPYLNFKSIEKKVLDSGKRYYEINSSKLPVGKKIKTIDLKTLYLKDFIDSDLKVKITEKKCNLEQSWIKVKKDNDEYKYDIYLECGLFKSKIDHEGPIIKLKGQDEITLYKGEKYKELGIESVIDNTDGNMNIKDVVIDTSELNISKVGIYEVKYKIKDSFDNETVKVRKVKVIQTLNNIIKSKKTNDIEENNYVMIDEILFKIVGINPDKSVKLVSDKPLSAISYNEVDSWLNNYFYEKFSDSAKKYIKNDSKWCIDKVSDTTKYVKCNKYSKKKPVGLLSISDYNNSKEKKETYSLNQNSLLSNLKDNKTAYYYFNSYQEISVDENVIVSPVINIIANASVVTGKGTLLEPYRLKGNNKGLKPGNKVSDAKVGSYVTYSGYNWRVISKEDDETTKIIMEDIVNIDSNEYYISFSPESKINYNIEDKNNIGYALINEISSYIKTDLLKKKTSPILNYKNKINYKEKSQDDKYSSKILLPSIYDLFSTTLYKDYWFMNHSSNSNTCCYMYYSGNTHCDKYDVNLKKGIRVVAYLNKNVTIKTGTGKNTDPYTLID